ncbi:hypothetical protein ElyMa_000831900 [Elysia marginata]|uniref:Uncharacterized protein n=1 Tax=Elysia marginata TaxID=1093978 RepID=A0AAV4GYI2_9GAST|nr:hypothetical protein ElyMa_000831900 [Elysia marginata]
MEKMTYCMTPVLHSLVSSQRFTSKTNEATAVNYAVRDKLSAVSAMQNIWKVLQFDCPWQYVKRQLSELHPQPLVKPEKKKEMQLLSMLSKICSRHLN